MHPWRMVSPYTPNLHSCEDVQSGGKDLMASRLCQNVLCPNRYLFSPTRTYQSSYVRVEVSTYVWELVRTYGSSYVRMEV